MALAMLFPTKNAQKPLFYRQKAPNEVVAQAALEDLAKQDVYAQAFAVDASLSEDYDLTNEVTKHPVEQGLDVSDNIKPQPITITMVMRQSDTPIRLIDIVGGLATSLGAQFGQQIGPLATQAGGAAAGALTSMIRNNQQNDRTRSKNMFDQFVTLRDAKALITVQTGLSVFRDMAIQSIRVNRTPSDRGSLKFSVTLVQIRTVQSISVKTPAIFNQTVADRAKQTAQKGRQSTKGITEQKSSSIAAKLFPKFLGGTAN